MTPQDRILDHYKHPYHMQAPDEAMCSFEGSYKNEGCGDYIHWRGCLEYTSEKRITHLWWSGEGCVFSQSAPSMLAEHCESKRLYEVEAFTQDDMLALFGIDIETKRVECVMVAYHALRKALENCHE